MSVVGEDGVETTVRHVVGTGCPAPFATVLVNDKLDHGREVRVVTDKRRGPGGRCWCIDPVDLAGAGRVQGSQKKRVIGARPGREGNVLKILVDEIGAMVPGLSIWGALVLMGVLGVGGGLAVTRLARRREL